VIKPAPVKKKVIVIGAGPGGMEAARVLATKGHNVKIYEKNRVDRRADKCFEQSTLP